MDELISNLQKKFNTQITYYNFSSTRNYCYFIKIKNKKYFLKLNILFQGYVNENIIQKYKKINLNIIKIYDELTKKKVVLPLYYYDFVVYKDKFILLTIVNRISGNLSLLENHLPINKEFILEKIVYKVLNILYLLLEDFNLVYFDIKIQNFLFDENLNIFITDFEQYFIKSYNENNELIKKTILTLQFYLFYYSFRKHYPDYDFFKNIRFFGKNEKILDFFISNEFFDTVFEYLIYHKSDFLNIINSYILNDKNKIVYNNYDILFLNKIKK